MKQFLCVLGLLFVFSVSTAWAQRPPGAGVAAALSAPQAEVSGGFSFIRDSGLNLKGWNASGAFNLNRWLGLAGDFGGHYATIDQSIPGFSLPALRLRPIRLLPRSCPLCVDS